MSEIHIHLHTNDGDEDDEILRKVEQAIRNRDREVRRRGAACQII